MVSMILPSAPVELLEELELELPPRSAIELSMNDEMIDCADAAPVEAVPDVASEELEAPPVSALIRLWNAELRLEVTLLGALDPPSRLPSNSLLADSVARLVSAATVEATLAVEAALVVELAGELGGTEAWLLPTLPIDIWIPRATAGIRVIGRDSRNLRKIFKHDVAEIEALHERSSSIALTAAAASVPASRWIASIHCSSE
jgi:hypothetical protein